MGKYNVDIYFYDETLFCVLFFCFCFRSFYNIILSNLNISDCSFYEKQSFLHGNERNETERTEQFERIKKSRNTPSPSYN